MPAADSHSSCTGVSSMDELRQAELHTEDDWQGDGTVTQGGATPAATPGSTAELACAEEAHRERWFRQTLFKSYFLKGFFCLVTIE